MAQLLHEIEWSEPILPIVADREWEAEVKRRFGHVGDVYRRIAPSPWLRRASLEWGAYVPSQLPARLIDILALVTSQENACRYCYGAARAQMKILGYSDKLINHIERETQHAELDEKERAFVNFCRNLSRSSPRPAKAEREALIRLGFTPQAVTEMAFLIVNWCFGNRLCTLLACTPEYQFENMASGVVGHLLAFAGPLMRPIRALKLRKAGQYNEQPAAPESSAFGPIAQAMAGLPTAALLHNALEGALASPVLPHRTKVLIFAVVARALGCGHCQREATGLLAADGFAADEVAACIGSFTSPKLQKSDLSILVWARDTVHYEPVKIQKATRALREEIGDAALLEAVGVASLANATVRLAMLLE